jgi:hypothetical protein
MPVGQCQAYGWVSPPLLALDKRVRAALCVPFRTKLKEDIRERYGTTNPLSLRPQVRWKRAPTLADQVQALDRLFGPPEIPLAPGSATPHQRQTLLLGAAEYDRLAAQVLIQDAASMALWQRLQKRCQELQQLAGK